MNSCELLDGCIFFNDNIKSMPKVVDTMKRLYCLWNYKQCARFRVASALSQKEVPADLFPGDITRAKIILAQHNYWPY